MKLSEFFQQNVTIKLKSGSNYQGFVDTYTPAIDNEEDEASIGVLTHTKSGIEIYESEIETIALA